MQHRRTARLAGWQIHLLSWSGAGLLVTGVAWLLLHHFGQREGDFGPEMNPLEPWMVTVHGFFLIPALLGIGTMLVAHIPIGWRHRGQRVAGIILSTLLAILIGTGYLLYYAGGETLRELSGTLHWVIGLVLPLAVAWHYLNARTLRGATRRR